MPHIISTYLALFVGLLNLVFLAVLLINTRRYKKSQDRLLEELDGSDQGRVFRINLSRPSFYPSYFKLRSFETKGILINGPEQVRVLAEMPSGEKLDRPFPKDNLGLSWLGNKFSTGGVIYWAGIGPVDDRLMISVDTGPETHRSRTATADLCRALDPTLFLPKNAVSNFALEKNPASFTAVIVFFTLILYAAGDFFFLIHFKVITHLPLQGSIAGLGLVLLFQCGWMLWKKVPVQESLILTVLLVVAIGLAAIPTEKRLGLVFTTDGPTSVSYMLGPGSTFEPISPGSPTLNFIFQSKYWGQFEIGSIHSFDLIRGPFGLVILDRTRLDQALQQFYQENDGSKKE